MAKKTTKGSAKPKARMSAAAMKRVTGGTTGGTTTTTTTTTTTIKPDTPTKTHQDWIDIQS